MKRIDITKKGDEWVAQSGSEAVARGTKKTDVVRQTARFARSGHEPVSVRIHGVNGRIQEERTYGRGADPRRSRG
jgi:hypothetical protein